MMSPATTSGSGAPRRRDDRIGEWELIENTGERLGQWFTVPGAQFGGVDLGQAGDRSVHQAGTCP